LFIDIKAYAMTTAAELNQPKASTKRLSVIQNTFLPFGLYFLINERASGSDGSQWCEVSTTAR